MTKDDLLEMLDGWTFTIEDGAYSYILGCDISYQGIVTDPRELLDSLEINIDDYDDFDTLLHDVSNAIDNWNTSNRLYGLEYAY